MCWIQFCGKTVKLLSVVLASQLEFQLLQIQPFSLLLMHTGKALGPTPGWDTWKKPLVLDSRLARFWTLWPSGSQPVDGRSLYKCILAHTHIHMFIHTHTQCTCQYMYHTYTSLYTYKYTHTHNCTDASIHISFIYACPYMCRHVCLYIYIYL